MEAVRLAEPADVARVADLARAAIAELAPMRGGAIWKDREARREPLEDDLKALLGRDDARVVVGTVDGYVVGYAVVRLEQLVDGSLLGIIDDIFVEEGARGVGVGDAMISDVVAWCEDHQCRGIDAMALPGHRSSKNFFEAAGFTARKLIMHRRPRGEGGRGDS